MSQSAEEERRYSTEFGKTEGIKDWQFRTDQKGLRKEQRLEKLVKSVEAGIIVACLLICNHGWLKLNISSKNLICEN